MRRALLGAFVVSTSCAPNEVARPAPPVNVAGEAALTWSGDRLTMSAPDRAVDGFFGAKATDVTRIARRDAAAQFVELEARALEDSPAVVHGAVVQFANAALDTDVVHVVSRFSTEEYRVLRSASAPTQFSYSLRHGSGVATLRLRDGTIDAVDAAGRTVLHMQAPYALDARGTRRDVAVELVSEQGAYGLRLSLDARGLLYPVIVDPKWTVVTPMTYPRRPFRMLPLGPRRFMLMGGDAGPFDYSSVEVYEANPFKTTLIQTRHSGNAGFDALLSSGKVLYGGGFDRGGIAQSTADIIDHEAATSTAAAPMAIPRAEAVAASTGDGRALVYGGYWNVPMSIERIYVSTSELYDSTTGTWSAGAPRAPARAYAQAIGLATKKILVTGGVVRTSAADTVTSTVEIYDVATNTWASAAAMKEARAQHRLLPLADGKIAAWGGSGTSSVEVYDPLLDTWTLVGNTTVQRNNHAALVSGKLLFGPAGSGDRSCELLDLATGMASPAASVVTARTEYGMAGLPGGEALIFGGYSQPGSSGVFLSTVEMYDPAATCTTSASCAPTEYCTAAKLCKPKLAVGIACSAADNCLSASCVDGVCCDKPCSGACEACSATTKGGGVDGACGFASADTDPRSACAMDPAFPGSCKADGLCDGMGACRALAKPTTPCAATTCASGSVSGSLCNGSGTCASSGAVSCAPYVCDAAGTACRTSCTSQAQCTSTAFCIGGVCVARLANGRACSAATQCASGHCVDAVCCDVACLGACQACSAALKGSGVDGTCGSVPAGTDPKNACAADPGSPASCKADGMCDATGACRINAPMGTACADLSCSNGISSAKQCDGGGACVNAAPVACGSYACDAAGTACRSSCTSDTDCATGLRCEAGACVAPPMSLRDDGAACSAATECKSGHCVDGVCCNVSCEGQCQACDAMGKVGTCSVVSGEPHGARAKCGTGTCVGQCDGVDSQRCVFPPESAPCAQSCSEGVVQSSVCRAGACVPDKQVTCDGIRCDGDRCKASCVTDLDCLGGHLCTDGVCQKAGLPEKVVQSGCGCSTPRTSGGAAWLFAAFALPLARRKRHRPAQGGLRSTTLAGRRTLPTR